MIRMFSKATKSHFNCSSLWQWRRLLCLLAAVDGGMAGIVTPSMAAESNSANAGGVSATLPASNGAEPTFNVQRYVIEGNLKLPERVTSSLLFEHTGANVSLDEIAKVALDVSAACQRQGYANVSIVISPQRITNGVVTLNVFQGAFSQIVIAGKRYDSSTPYSPMAANPAPTEKAQTAGSTATPVPAPSPAPVIHVPQPPATAEQMAKDREALMKQMAELMVKENDHQVHVVSTNAGPHFEIKKYLVMGNSVLVPRTLSETLTNIDGAYGTNVSLDGIRTAVSELQKAYRERGYVTVTVGLPQQKLTNATVKIQVTEGRLADIYVKGNQYFSSNNVMRALPSLHTNMILNAQVFQSELNRANANQDRQIYPVISPGPDPGTSDLTLKVKDQLPLHGKVDFNNESSPGTPDLRVNTSAVYNNLWQLEHSVGVQYGFSPEKYKTGEQWNFYDRPLVANYSGFYRMPLGTPPSVEEAIEANPGSFGYDEATRRFNLPPPSGQMELNIYGSRSTIDTGLQSTPQSLIFDFPGVEQISQNEAYQDNTINEDAGFRLTTPLHSTDDFHSVVSGGLDYKVYNDTSYKTNIFELSQITLQANGQPNPPTLSDVFSPVPTTGQNMQYMPVSLRYDANWHDSYGAGSFGLGGSVNAWYSSTTTADGNLAYRGEKSLQNITGSTRSTGHWLTVNPSFTHDFTFWPDWVTTVRADGQWTTEPLISTEQYSIGGVNSVRGYREGEVFGDTGWHISLEEQTPSVVVGMAYGNTPLTLRGLIYTDYGEVYLLDPLGRSPHTDLYSAGFGGMASIGSHWQARFLFSLPLSGGTTTQQYVPYVNFGLTAQF